MERLMTGLSEADVHGYAGMVLLGLGLGWAFGPGIGIAVVGALLVVMGFMLGRSEPPSSPADPGRFDGLNTADDTGLVEGTR